MSCRLSVGLICYYWPHRSPLQCSSSIRQQWVRAIDCRFGRTNPLQQCGNSSHKFHQVRTSPPRTTLVPSTSNNGANLNERPGVPITGIVPNQNKPVRTAVPQNIHARTACARKQRHNLHINTRKSGHTSNAHAKTKPLSTPTRGIRSRHMQQTRTCCIIGPILWRMAAWNMSLADSSESPSRTANSSSLDRYSLATTPVAPMDSATAFWNVVEHSWNLETKQPRGRGAQGNWAQTGGGGEQRLFSRRKAYQYLGRKMIAITTAK